MKSGLYACAGASATASAAACANRFDEPITNESNVYFGFIVDPAPRRRAPRLRHGPGRLDVLLDDEPDAALRAGSVANRGSDQVEEMALDPLAREVVGHGEDELLVVSSRLVDVAEPGAEGRVVQRLLKPARDFGPETLCCQLLLLRHGTGPTPPLGVKRRA